MSTTHSPHPTIRHTPYPTVRHRLRRHTIHNPDIRRLRQNPTRGSSCQVHCKGGLRTKLGFSNAGPKKRRLSELVMLTQIFLSPGELGERCIRVCDVPPTKPSLNHPASHDAALKWLGQSGSVKGRLTPSMNVVAQWLLPGLLWNIGNQSHGAITTWHAVVFSI